MSNPQYRDFQEEQNQEDIPHGVPVGHEQIVYQPQTYYSQGQNPTYPAQQYGHQPPMFAQPQLMFPNPQQANFMQQRGYNYSVPMKIQCPCCQMQVTTIVNQEPGNSTYLWAAGVFFGCCASGLIGCCCYCCATPACCLPFVMDQCLDKNHYCPRCGFNIMRKHQECCDFV